MDYKELIVRARNEGRANEEIMWKSVDAVSSLLDSVRGMEPEVYDRFMRSQYELYYGSHYDEVTAEHDVRGLYYTDRDGIERTGPHWTLRETTDATAGVSFPAGTTKYDVYVALNAAYADFCRKFDDAQIVDIAILFFFKDEDWSGDGKIWKYMSINR